MAATKSARIHIRQVRSAIGANPSQAGTLKALGLGRIGSETERVLTDQLKGQIAVITHLVETEEVS